MSLNIGHIFNMKCELNVKINRNLNRDIRREVARRLNDGARRIAATARQLAPFDSDSRVAKGASAKWKHKWPAMHHARSIRVVKASERNLGAGVKTVSGRFYFIEYPTRRGVNGKSGKYVTVRDARTGRRKRGHGATRRIGVSTMRTPGQPHFWPAVQMNTPSIYSSLEGLI